jgi:hypothetical protein
MKIALISAGLFLVSYVAVNRGFGPNPLALIVPLAVVVGTALAARWVMRRGARTKRAPADEVFAAKMGLARDAPLRAPPLPEPPMPAARPMAPPPPRSGKARKLF